MKRILISVLALALTGIMFAQVLSCYDVQYTESPSGDSPYAGQIATVEGIVVQQIFYTGTAENNKGFVISDPEGGPWSGLMIFTNQYTPQRGDKVRVTGTITEYFGYTEMSPTTGFQVISQGNPIPPPTLIQTSDLVGSNAEQWESVFVKVENVSVTSLPNNHNEFKVNDGSGACQIDDQCFPRSGFSWPQMSVGQVWARIQGVVDYSFDEYGLNPRDMTDMLQTLNVQNSAVRVQTTSGVLNEEKEINVLTTRMYPNWGVASYNAQFGFDPAKVKFERLEFEGTMTGFEPDYSLSEAGDMLEVIYQSQEPIHSSADDQVLIKLIVTPIAYGESEIKLLSFAYDNTPIVNISNGKLMVPINKNMAWLNIRNEANGRNIFNPELNEKLTIEYGIEATASGVNAKAIVRIYDAQGRLVATPVNRNIGSSLGIENYVWDGRDYMTNKLPIGLYYCHLEIIDRATGHKESTVQPIVIKAKMK